jgi:uncharacterized protein YkwD
MKAKLFFGIVLVALVLSACTPTVSSQPTLLPPTVIVSTSVPTLAPTLVPTLAPTLAPTLVPTLFPTLAPTLVPTLPLVTVSPVAPVSPLACADSAGFVADVTVPDNTNFKQGTAFVKTWRIRNTGTCTWDSNYTLFFTNGTQMGGPASVPFTATAPNATMDLSVNLVSPASDGAYTAKYELHDASGKPFSIDGGRYVWVTITVGTAIASPTASSAGTGAGTSGTCKYVENATLVSQLLNLINAARTANGLTALTLNPKLGASAMSHSIDMACNSSLSHAGSDGSTIKSRIAAQGYTYSYADEAIFAQPPEYGGTAQAAVDWWLNDPEHRAILLNAKATEIGFGYAYVAGSALGGYFTADVGAP